MLGEILGLFKCSVTTLTKKSRRKKYKKGVNNSFSNSINNCYTINTYIIY